MSSARDSMLQHDLRLPDFLIIGEMKCGSTTLWELLSRHPQIFLPDDKELHFFNARADKDRLSLAQYASYFAAADRDHLVGEATPNYLFDHHAAIRIHQIVPDTRLIAILRDPVARAWSHYWHNVRRGREPLGFDAALRAEPKRIATDLDARLHFSYVTRGYYVQSLQYYAEIFGHDRICVVFLEELSSRPETVMRSIFTHLGLDGDLPDLSAAPAQRNRAEFPRWPWLDRATRSARRYVVTNYPRLASSILMLGRLSRPLRTYSGQPQMKEELRECLRRSFEDSDVALSQWLGRVPPWRSTAG